MIFKKFKTSRRTVVIIAGILLLIILSAFGFFGFFKSGVVFVLSPVTDAYHGFANFANNAYLLTFKKENFISRAEEAEALLQTAAIDYVKFEALKEENESLKKTIGYVAENDLNIVAAKVLTSISAPNEKKMLIDLGSSDGIGPGMVVMAGEGIVIGQIIECENRLSWIRLITDPRSKLPAKILGDNQTTGIVSGTYGSLARMDLIPQQQKININDFVVTSNMEPGVPADLLIGVINQIDEPGNEPFKSALIEPVGNFSVIKYVSVIIYP